MINTRKVVEKRKHPRLEAHEGAYAAIKSDSIKVGPLINISKGGLAFQYIGNGRQIEGLHKLAIFLRGNHYRLENVSFKIISDFLLDNRVPYSTIMMKRCGGQFGELTPSQESQLEYFLANHTTD